MENHPDTQLDVVSLDQEQYKYKLENINIKKSKKLDILSRVFLHSTYFYLNWRKIRKKVLKNAYDLVIIGNSKLGFVAKDFRKFSIKTKVVTHFDNIEYDAVYSYYADKKGLLSKLMSWFDRIVTRRDELCSIKYSSKTFFLSKRDMERAETFYNSTTNYSIWPVTIKEGKPLTITQSKTIIYLGTLNYGSNLKAIEWFLDNVWYKYENQIKFIIAGSNPTPFLYKKVEQYKNITIYSNFDELSDIIPKYSLLIAPVFWGAGMKVKVAEALSYGLLIAGTDELFIGYDNVIFRSGVYKANTIKEMYQTIDDFIRLSPEEITKASDLNRKIWKAYYSQDYSNGFIEHFLNSLNN